MSNTASNSFQRNEEKECASTRMLSAALELHEAGFAVIPLKPRSEEPFLSWKELQGSKPTVEQIKGWFAQEPEINIGILTGAFSGIVVLHVDGKRRGDMSIPEKLPDFSGLVASTGHGRNYYFKHPGFEIQNLVNLLPGVDLLGEGGYVTAPPSRPRNYEFLYWLSGPDKSPPPIPDWLRELLIEKRDRAAAHSRAAKAGTSSTHLAALPEQTGSLNALSKGARNDGLLIGDHRLRSVYPTIRSGFTLLRASKIEAKPIFWLWEPVLALGKVSMIAGDPGVAKSHLVDQHCRNRVKRRDVACINATR